MNINMNFQVLVQNIQVFRSLNRGAFEVPVDLKKEKKKV